MREGSMMRSRKTTLGSPAVALCLLFLGLIAGPAAADRPRVLKAIPDDGATGVDPATRELRVSFDQDMDQRGIERDVLVKAFDALWNDMDRHYSYFELKKIDWQALKRKYRPRALAAESLPEFGDVLGEMLGELNDDHVWFTEAEGATIARRGRPWSYNGNAVATESAIQNKLLIGNGFAQTGTTTPDDFGVIRIVRQSQADAEAVAALVAFIRSHCAAPGFIVDLRLADGGSEPLAQQIACEFCARETVYAKSKYRNGPKPADFGPVYDRTLKPSERPFTKPVVCILGPGCISSGEGFAKMMKCLPHVTTIGMPTRGSSGNPKPFKLPAMGVTVMYSRWVDMLPDGTPIEGHGVLPNVVVDKPESDYQTSDPTWDRAVELLRSKIKKAG
jgi:hypothetical protein